MNWLAWADRVRALNDAYRADVFALHRDSMRRAIEAAELLPEGVTVEWR